MKKKENCKENEITMFIMKLYICQIYELKARSVKGQQGSFAAWVEVFVWL